MDLKKKKRLADIVRLLEQHEEMFDRIPCAQHTWAAHWDKMKPLLEMKSYFEGTLREEHSQRIKEGIHGVAQANREKNSGPKEQDRAEEEE